MQAVRIGFERVIVVLGNGGDGGEDVPKAWGTVRHADGGVRSEESEDCDFVSRLWGLGKLSPPPACCSVIVVGVCSRVDLVSVRRRRRSLGSNVGV